MRASGMRRAFHVSVCFLFFIIRQKWKGRLGSGEENEECADRRKGELSPPVGRVSVQLPRTRT